MLIMVELRPTGIRRTPCLRRLFLSLSRRPSSFTRRLRTFTPRITLRCMLSDMCLMTRPRRRTTSPLTICLVRWSMLLRISCGSRTISEKIFSPFIGACFGSHQERCPVAGNRPGGSGSSRPSACRTQ
uniref:Uncharacterized protein n=1 Tax=Rat stool-associated circular ssDNA virus TaxID=1699316 RepID=A0A0S2LUN6_9VIRU|nr:hypothetical protein [Rat stool-associated circular ssDNA virus]